MLNRKFLISALMAFVVLFGGIFAFVIIPAQIGKFHAATAIPQSASVSGNGGSAVMVGEYLYFVNGYKSKEDYEYKENEYNNKREQFEGGIWRVKMSAGMPEYDNTYLTDYLAENEFPDWENRYAYGEFNGAKNATIVDTTDKKKKIKDDNLELIVPKIAGWENTAIWIYGDTIVYTSPNNQKNRKGELQNKRIDFFTCNLRGEKHRKIYTTRTDNIELTDFTVAWADENPYLLIKDGEELNRITMRGNIVTITDKCESAVFPVVTGYYGNQMTNVASLINSFSGIMSYVFYTEARDEDEDIRTGNHVFAYQYGNTDKNYTTESVQVQDNNRYTLIALGNGHLVSKSSEANKERTIYITNDHLDLKQYQKTNIQTEETAHYVSGERTSTFRLLSSDGSKIRVRNLAQNEVEKIISVADMNLVLSVNMNNVMYKNSGGGIVTIYYTGDDKNDNSPTASTNNIVDGARVTTFRVLDKDGGFTTYGGYMFFYIKSLTEIISTDSTTTTETSGMAQAINVGTIGCFDGSNEYMLARLDTDKYVDYPEKPTNDEGVNK